MIDPNYFDNGGGEDVVNKPAKGGGQPLQIRIKAMRKVYGFQHAVDFAAALTKVDPADPVTTNAWGNVEGGGGLTTKNMLKIRRLCPGVTWEWLHLGDEAHLMPDLCQRLRSAVETELTEWKSKTTGKKGRSGTARGSRSSSG